MDKGSVRISPSLQTSDPAEGGRLVRIDGILEYEVQINIEYFISSRKLQVVRRRRVTPVNERQCKLAEVARHVQSSASSHLRLPNNVPLMGNTKSRLRNRRRPSHHLFYRTM